jgi:hypothetical protein
VGPDGSGIMIADKLSKYESIDYPSTYRSFIEGRKGKGVIAASRQAWKG